MEATTDLQRLVQSLLIEGENADDIRMAVDEAIDGHMDEEVFIEATLIIKTTRRHAQVVVDDEEDELIGLIEYGHYSDIEVRTADYLK